MTSQTSSPTTLTQYPAHALAQLIADGSASALEVTEAYIERIERVNPPINALVVKRYDEARSEARAADQRRAAGGRLGPLHGVPITVKECLDLAGTASTFGLTTRANHRAEHDDPYVARLRAAGAVVLGKTNVAQALLFAETDNPVYGRTNNPWNNERSSGGSSGGEGAILGAGGSALGIGTDIGGSVRFPANFCGVASLKPTSGRADDRGRLSLPIGQRAIVSQVGILARTVADVALGTALITAGQPGLAPIGDPSMVDLRRLRVACYTDDGTLPVAPAVRRAVHEAAAALRAAGAQVADWQPPDVPHAVDLFYRLLTADGARLMAAAGAGSALDPRVKTLQSLSGSPRWVLAAMAGLLRISGQGSLAQALGSFGHTGTRAYWRAVEEQIDYRAQFARALDTAAGGPFDAILCPVSPVPAFVHGATADVGTAGGYTILYNVLGYPAGVVPVTRVQPGEELALGPSKDRALNALYRCQQGSAGLPVGVQVVARPWQEHMALAAMQCIEGHCAE